MNKTLLTLRALCFALGAFVPAGRADTTNLCTYVLVLGARGGRWDLLTAILINQCAPANHPL